MTKTMKLTTLLAAALCALATAVQAQQYETAYLSTTILAGGTNNLASFATNTYNLAVTATKWGDLALECQFKAAETGCASNIIVVLSKGSTATNRTTITGNQILWSIAANGTSYAVGQTNVTLDNLGYLFVEAVRNANLSNVTVTNLTIWAVRKPRRTG